MKKLLIFVLLSVACLAQTMNTFPALKHFPGAPTNPCQATFLAQNDATDAFYTCDVNTLNWAPIGGPGSFVGYPFSGFPRVVFVISDGVGNPTQYGHTNAPGVLGTAANTAPTATETGAKSYTSAAAASLNILAMTQQGFGASNGFYTYGSSFRFTTRLKLNNTTNVRYWFGGVTDFPPGSGSAFYASDTPNTNYCMFRFSAGVDTTIKAVCATSNVNQTVVDTGVSVDTTASHLFDVQFGVGSAIFTIDGTTSVLVSSNVPAAGTTFGNVSFIADNKNTNTAVGATFYWMTLLQK